ncbi:MAG: hypothetical protein M1815_000396 [Lichina confinis]|nr:MAG: hypothetical protein M1815_000396 [Lichina confinis]
MKRRASDGSEWDRLSIPFPIRVMVYTGIGSLTGVMLGMSRGGKMAGLRFRAENAHRQPSTTTGWYLYHKSKNYNVLYGGIGEAFRMAARLGVMIASFTVVEEAVDRLRGHKDFLSTVVAGLGTSGAFSAIKRFPLHTATRTAKMGLVGGLSVGLLQDALSLAKGRKIRYVEFIKHRVSSPSPLEPVSQSKTSSHFLEDDNISVDENISEDDTHLRDQQQQQQQQQQHFPRLTASSRALIYRRRDGLLV